MEFNLMPILEPSTDTYIEWKHLSYIPSVEQSSRIMRIIKPTNFNSKKDDLPVLDNVSGYIKTGTLTALIGPSGCGKTTLLAAVSQRIKGNLTGDIFINKRNVSSNEMKSLSGFVPQYDISIPTLTPTEHLFFLLQLVQNGVSTKHAKTNRIQMILRQLGLTTCSNVSISRLSGGERRKLILASTMINDPLILFCDEITTGLDSFHATSVIKSLRALAGIEALENNAFDSNKNYKKAIICSLHQPSSNLFQEFTHMILMSCGKIVFQGTIEDAASVFSQAGLNCPLHYNPAEFYINVATNPNAIAKLRALGREKKLNHTMNGFASDLAVDLHFNNEAFYKKKVPWLQQLHMLVRRSAKSGVRNYKEHIFESSLFLFTAVIIGVLYSQVVPNTQASIQDISGALFNLNIEAVFTYSYYVVFLIPSHLPLLRREIGEDLYSLSAYYISKIIILIPKVIIESFIIVGILRIFTQFEWTFMIYLKICITYIFTGFTAMSYGFFLSGLFESVRLTLELAPPIDLLLLVLCGIFINIRSFPYLRYISPFYYVTEATSIIYWSKVSHIECYDNSDYPCIRNGTEVLEKLGYGTDESEVWFDYLGLSILFLIGHTLGYLGIRKMVLRQGFY